MATTSWGSLSTAKTSRVSELGNHQSMRNASGHNMDATHMKVQISTDSKINPATGLYYSARIRVYAHNANQTTGGTSTNITVLLDGKSRQHTITFPQPKQVLNNGYFLVSFYHLSSISEYSESETSAVWVARSGTGTNSTRAVIVYGTIIENPRVTEATPNTTISNRTPDFRFRYFHNQGLNNIRYRVYIREGSTIRSDTGNIYSSIGLGNFLTLPHNPSSFQSKFTELEYGKTYNWRITLEDERFFTATYEYVFAISQHAPTAAISAPLSGLFDRTPQIVATFNDNLGHTAEETLWTIRNSTGTIIGQSLPGVNSLTPTYDPDNTTFWQAGAQELQFGQTYSINLRVKCSDGVWSATVTRVFSIGMYAPVMTVTEPPAKIDTLNPTIKAVYSSAQEIAKNRHRFEIWNSTMTALVGQTVDIVNGTEEVEMEYTDTWAAYTELQWGTQYTAVVRVRDTEDTWNVIGVPGSVGTKIFKTNSYPTIPDTLYPSGTSITTTTPILTAMFRDPDVGDTPSVMEVEMRDADTNNLVLQRTSAGTGNNFDVFLADGLEVEKTYRWRTRFTDQGGLQGAWSDWATFTVIEGADITFTHPVQDEVLDTPQQTFTWTYTHPLSVAQASSRLRIYQGASSIVIYDSGAIAGSYLSQELPSNLLRNNTDYRVQLVVTDASGQANTSNFIRFRTSWSGPPQPDNVTTTVDNTLGTVTINWEPTDEADFMGYRVYRQDPENANNPWVEIAQLSNIYQNTYVYHFAPSGKPYRYAIAVVVDLAGSHYESNIVSYTTETVSFPTKTILSESVLPDLYRVELMRNPTRQESYGRESVVIQPLGRSRPIVHVGNAYNREMTVSFAMKIPYNDSLVLLNQMIARGHPILYRDGRGRRMWIALYNYSITDELPDKITLTLSFQEVYAQER